MQKNYFVTGRLNYLMAFKLQSVKFELRLPNNVPSNGLTLDLGGGGRGEEEGGRLPMGKRLFRLCFLVKPTTS